MAERSTPRVQAEPSARSDLCAEHVVWTSEITEEQSPVLLGELRSTAVVEAMRVQGNELHLAQHSGNEWQGCTSGHYCPRGTHVALFDVSDPASPVPLGEQDGAQSPFVHMVPYKDHALVRTFNGFAIYQAVPVP